MSQLRKSAEGESCTLTIYPHCNGDTRTTVLAHIKTEQKGMGIKSPDFFAVYACSDCHDIIDKRRYVDLSETEIKNCILRGLYRTWKRIIEKGLISINE